jgi:UDP:flavonoid glycosyltransferase YjiC (YdhE family)
VVPFANDQFDNARRLEALGVGSQLQTAAYTPSAVADALQKLLRDREIRIRAAEIATRFRGIDGADQVCDVLEQSM